MIGKWMAFQPSGHSSVCRKKPDDHNLRRNRSCLYLNLSATNGCNFASPDEAHNMVFMCPGVTQWPSELPQLGEDFLDQVCAVGLRNEARMWVIRRSYQRIGVVPLTACYYPMVCPGAPPEWQTIDHRYLYMDCGTTPENVGWWLTLPSHKISSIQSSSNLQVSHPSVYIPVIVWRQVYRAIRRYNSVKWKVLYLYDLQCGQRWASDLSSMLIIIRLGIRASSSAMSK